MSTTRPTWYLLHTTLIPPQVISVTDANRQRAEKGESQGALALLLPATVVSAGGR